jgi:hypothetical protein
MSGGGYPLAGMSVLEPQGMRFMSGGGYPLAGMSVLEPQGMSKGSLWRF